MYRLLKLYLLPGIVIIMLALVIACEEEPPFINFDEPKTTIDTTFVKAIPAAAQVKQVLLEDVTGVQCVNCPDAATIAKALQVANPGRVNVVALHPKDLLDNFTKPITKAGHESKQDFRTPEAATICKDILGVPNSLPKGGIDRVKFADKSDLLLDRTDWTAKVNAQLLVPPPMNITLTKVPGKANEIIVDVEVEYTVSATDTNYLTILLVEDSIIDVQEYIDYSLPIPAPDYNNNYNHMHIVRAAMTSATGDLLNKANAPLVPGRVFKRRYVFNVTNPIWVLKHMDAIAFVHRNGSTKTVLQTAHLTLGE